jgi:hypothetical protein
LLLRKPDLAVFADDRSRGIQAVPRRLRIEGKPEAPFLDVRCAEPAGREAFQLVAGEIVDSVRNGVPVGDAVEGTLARWRRFWANVPLHGLSDDQIRGLFGELWFLVHWLLPHGVANVRRWVGAEAARQDFQWPGLAVECKATLSARGHVHRINGLDQLATPEQGELFLYSIRLREETTSERSLVTLVDQVSRLLAVDAALLDLFETRLGQGGYSPLHSERYRTITFTVVDERLYNVTAAFPRITPASFRAGLPLGVERVDYDVNLETCDALCVARKPQELPSTFHVATRGNA